MAISRGFINYVQLMLQTQRLLSPAPVKKAVLEG